MVWRGTFPFKEESCGQEIERAGKVRMGSVGKSLWNGKGNPNQQRKGPGGNEGLTESVAGGAKQS